MRACLQDLMVPVAAWLTPSESLGMATTRLLEIGEGEIYVVDESHRLVGVVTDYEILKARLAGVGCETPVERIMSRPHAVFEPTFCAERLAAVLRDGRYSRVPVTEKGRLVGQVSRRDVLRMIVILEELDGAVQQAPAEHSQSPCSDRFRRPTNHRAHHAGSLHSIDAINLSRAPRQTHATPDA